MFVLYFASQMEEERCLTADYKGVMVVNRTDFYSNQGIMAVLFRNDFYSNQGGFVNKTGWCRRFSMVLVVWTISGSR
ncbi:unnamed protein product [Lota lota]